MATSKSSVLNTAVLAAVLASLGMMRVAQADQLAATVGLPIDPGDNACPTPDLNRCANATGGQWEELPGLPGITFMHAVLLANTRRVLFWGYGPPALSGRTSASRRVALTPMSEIPCISERCSWRQDW